MPSLMNDYEEILNPLEEVISVVCVCLLAYMALNGWCKIILFGMYFAGIAV